MKRILPFIMLLMTAPLAARADITSRFASSVQLSVGGAHTSAVSAGTITAGVYSPGTIAATQDTAGSAFSFSQSYTAADAVPTAAPTVGNAVNFGNISSTAGGTVGSLAGQTSSAHTFSAVAAGGANTSATTQFVTEVTVR